MLCNDPQEYSVANQTISGESKINDSGNHTCTYPGHSVHSHTLKKNVPKMIFVENYSMTNWLSTYYEAACPGIEKTEKGYIYL